MIENRACDYCGKVVLDKLIELDRGIFICGPCYLEEE